LGLTLFTSRLQSGVQPIVYHVLELGAYMFFQEVPSWSGWTGTGTNIELHIPVWEHQQAGGVR